MSDSFDVVVIGSGPGGYVAAIRAAQFGASVACVDNRELGGTCLNRGCIPTKALLEASHLASMAKEAAAFGVRYGEPEIDFPAMMDRKDKVVATLTGGIGSLFKKNGVEHVPGTATLTSKEAISVALNGGGTRTLAAKKIIVATGSEPMEIPPFPFDDEHVLSSTSILELREQPKSLVVVGGGYIGCEFACFFAELGTEVHVIEMLDNLLSLGGDADVSKAVTTGLKKRKVKVATGTKVESIEVKDGTVLTTLSDGKTLKTEKALISVGRKLNSDTCGLENAGVELGERKEIPVNAHCQTNVPNIYAIGDVTGKILLAHFASRMGIVAAEHAMGHHAVLDERVCPATVFTHPEASYVGLTEQQATDQGIAVKSFRFPIQVLGKAQATGDLAGFVKLVGEAETGEVIGAQIVSSKSGSMIHEITLGMQLEATIEELAKTIHVHPTLAEGIMEAAEGWLGHGIHYNG
jgi:dihydrolipoamide dehydrogenase